MKRLLVISGYPPAGTTHHKSVLGGAAYTKSTLIALKKEILKHGGTPQITVLAQELGGVPNSYQDEGIGVKRIWRRNSFLTFGKLLIEIAKNHKHTKTILIELELNIFGKSAIHLGLFILFLLLLRLIGKKVIVVMHEVIIDINELAGHINLKKGSLRSAIMNVGLRSFYKALYAAAGRIIVFEKVLQDRFYRLNKNRGKIKVIPIAIEIFKENMSQQEARKELGISQNSFVAMSFGFLAWYKGTDWLAEVWPKDGERENLQLLIAGGANPNRLDLPYYQKYLSNLEKICEDKNITLTGFIPEEKMHLYFAASDLIVFPFRTQMSSSATISQAFSFEKPLLLSENMIDMFATHDMGEALIKSDLEKEEITFKLDGTFMGNIESLRNNPESLRKLSLFSQKMKQARSWEIIGKQYYETIFN